MTDAHLSPRLHSQARGLANDELAPFWGPSRQRLERHFTRTQY